MDPERTTLAQARVWLHARIREGGAACPCCGQLAKVYDRKLNSGMATSLVRMYRAALRSAEDGWVHLPTQLPARSREEGKLAYWDLAYEADEKREDGGRAGWWHLTELGEQFAMAHARVPKYARVYDGRLRRLIGPLVTIRECFKDPFDYDELMNG